MPYLQTGYEKPTTSPRPFTHALQMHILKDILREIHAMHVALQADHHQGGQHQAKHHHQVKQEGLRESQLNSLKQQASKLTPEQVTQYER
jgi:hypothetical protein